MAVVEGEVPKSSEKRLVLDDEEMDPLLTNKAGATPEPDAPAALDSAAATESVAPVAVHASEPVDLIDAALDDVFNEVR